MKTLRLLVVLASLLFAGVAAPSSARAETSVSFDFFYDSLAPYGDWVQVGDYGLCWRPTGVDSDWTPYSDGYWAYTDAGWTWVSYEEFGGIVYHYGRWIRLDDDSWCWAPDYEWGPAWVAWRSNDDYVGWAPLPPEARWRRDVGISVWVDRECDLGPGYYSFCRVRDFGAPVLRGVLINRRENVTIIRSTVNVTNITYNTTYADGPVIFNGGPSFAVMNRVSARPLPALKLVQEVNFDPARHRGPNGRVGFHAQTVGNQLIVAAPRVLRPTDPAEFRSRAKRVYAGDSVTRGWGVVKDATVQKELRQEMVRQSKGLTPATAPARAVAAADLKVVPTKADPTATPPSTATNDRRGDHPERSDRPGKGHRPESVATQPNTNNPPTTSTTNPPTGRPTTPPVTTTPPGTTSSEPTGVARGRGRDKNDRNPNDRNSTPPNAPTTSNPNLKPFNPEPSPRQTQNPPTNVPPGSRNTSTDDNAARERAAEQARSRGEQQQRMEQQQQRLEQQRQAESAAKQKQADMAAEQKKQIGAQQEAARARADEQRRREATDQQRQQQQQMRIQQQPQQQQRQQQSQQQQQEQQQRAQDARRAQDADRAAREHGREQSENQRSQQMRQQPSQPQQQQNNQGGNAQRGGGNGGQHSKGGNDKDKDKDRN